MKIRDQVTAGQLLVVLENRDVAKAPIVGALSQFSLSVGDLAF